MSEKMEKQKSDQNINSMDKTDIEFLQIVKLFWDGRKTILIYTIAGIFIGILVALFSPKEYTASATMIPQLTNNNSSSMSGLSGLAAIAGFDVDGLNSGSEISPVIYPKIVNSVPFQLELMHHPIQFKEADHPISIYSYYTEIQRKKFLNVVKKYTIALPGTIINALKKEKITTENRDGNPLTISNNEEIVRNIIRESIRVEVNQKEGIIVIKSRLSQAKPAAELAQHVLYLLQHYITKIKIEKASENLAFIDDRYNEKKIEFKLIQSKLAEYRDANKNIISAIVRTEEESLQSEYNIAFSVYSELTKQLEQAKIKVKEDTPVFTIIDPVVIPNKKSKPNKVLILFIWLIAGGLTGTIILIGREYFSGIKKQWKNINDKK